MPRETYDYLHPATRRQFEKNVKAIANGWNKDQRYIYQILAEERTDFATAFFAQYEGVCAGGVAPDEYDHEMAFIREKYGVGNGKVRETGEAVTDGFKGFGRLFERYMSAMADGKLDLEETNDMLKILDILKPQVETLETSLIVHKTRLEKEV